MKSNIKIISTFVVGILVLVVIFFIGRINNIPYEVLTGDPANYYKFHPLSGILSNLGVLIWCATCAICLFAGIKINSVKNNYSNGGFLVYAGILTFLLLIDDFFLLHDHMLRQKPMYLFYGMALVYFVFKYFNILKEGHSYLFYTSVFFFFLSMAMDSILPSRGLEYFIEDGFKFLGILSWALFFITTSFKSISKN